MLFLKLTVYGKRQKLAVSKYMFRPYFYQFLIARTSSQLSQPLNRADNTYISLLLWEADEMIYM